MQGHRIFNGVNKTPRIQIREWLKMLREEIKIDAHRQMNAENKAKEYKRFENKWLSKGTLVKTRHGRQKGTIKKMRIIL